MALGRASMRSAGIGSDSFERDVFLSLGPVDAVLVRLLVLILSCVILLLSHREESQQRERGTERLDWRSDGEWWPWKKDNNGLDQCARVVSPAAC